MTQTPAALKAPPAVHLARPLPRDGRDMVQISSILPQSTPITRPPSGGVRRSANSADEHPAYGEPSSSAIPRSPQAAPEHTYRYSLPTSPSLCGSASCPASPQKCVRDLERQQITRHHGASTRSSSVHRQDSPYECLEGEENWAFVESKALKIMIYLSGIVGLVSLAIALWTWFALIIVTILQPLRLFKEQPTYRKQLISFLSPALTLQLLLIYSSKRSDAHNAKMLVLVHLLSPLISIGVAIAAWTAAVFWLYAAIIGDPSGSGRPERHNDGRASVLGVRAWWEHWLTRALR